MEVSGVTAAEIKLHLVKLISITMTADSLELKSKLQRVLRDYSVSYVERTKQPQAHEAIP